MSKDNRYCMVRITKHDGSKVLFPTWVDIKATIISVLTSGLYDGTMAVSEYGPGDVLYQEEQIKL